MSPSIDVEMLKALGLQDQDARISSHASSQFSSTFKLTTTTDGEPRNYFVKIGTGKDAAVMFKGTEKPNKHRSGRKGKKKLYLIPYPAKLDAPSYVANP